MEIEVKISFYLFIIKSHPSSRVFRDHSRFYDDSDDDNVDDRR